LSTAYDVLGVSPDATQDEIKRAYRSRARRTHPDAGGSPEDFVRVSRAWDQVHDASSRAAYDERLRASTPPRTAPDVAPETPAAEWGSHEYFAPGGMGNNPRPAPRPSWPYPPPGWRPPAGTPRPYPPPGWRPPTNFPRRPAPRPPSTARPDRSGPAIPREKRSGPYSRRGALLWWPVSFVYWWALLIGIAVLSTAGRDLTAPVALMLFGWLPALRYFRRQRTRKTWVALGLVAALFAAVAYETHWAQIGGLITLAGLVIGVELVRRAVLSSKEMLIGGHR